MTMATLFATAGLLIGRWDDPTDLVSGALRLDDLAIAISLIAILSACFAVLLSIREPATDRPARASTTRCCSARCWGWSCSPRPRTWSPSSSRSRRSRSRSTSSARPTSCREKSLESGLKYLIVGSLGSATLLYGLAFLYGGSGSTDFAGIAAGIQKEGLSGDSLVLIGIALSAVGFAFKTSVAPFHQWTPDVYEGAPTPITAFMAVATKAAAFAVFVRFFDVALISEASDWQPALAVLAAISIVVGNVGALGQSSLKRLLGYSGVAQAGYILGGLVVATEAGRQRPRLLPRRLRVHELRRLRRRRRP